MSEKLYYEERPAVQLRTWVLGQMLRGAGYGALFVVGIGLFLYAVYLFGLVLPEASKQAPPPMGWVIEAPASHLA
jgi:hypothetical protein